MSWFLPALAAVLGWGFADVLYKKNSDEKDSYSHLKIAVCVGLVMGAVSFVLLALQGEKMTFSDILSGAAAYSPASLSYIASMVIGYAGMRYLEISIISPVQNASGAFSALLMAAYFLLTGRMQSLKSEFSVPDALGTALIVAGVIVLAVAEKKVSKSEQNEKGTEKKYRTGAFALVFPLLYCVFDTVGTAADGIILDAEAGISLSETQVLILYGLTFLFFAAAAWLYMLIREKRAYNPFSFSEHGKLTAALCEEAGQVFYVFAMAENPVLAAPMISSYCIISVILSRILLKEKLNRLQYGCVLTVISGIVLLGVSESIG